MIRSASFSLVCLCALVLARPASAQEGEAVSSSAVDLSARTVLQWLRSEPDPGAAHFRAAGHALGIVRRLAPDDAELARWQAGAWNAAGERAALLETTRDLVRIDPGDAPAQLRLALAGIARIQTAEARLAAAERIAGPAGDRLDPSVRSRVALDGALLARDHGDEDLFAWLIARASEIDPTNKEAAALLAATYLAVSDDPIERFDLLANVILADPADPQAYDNAAAELIQYGAYDAAYRMLSLFASIEAQNGRPLDPQRILDFSLCEWNTKGPEQALSRIQRVLNDTKAQEQARRAAIIADGRDPGPERPMLLPPGLQLFRLAVAVGQKNNEGAGRIIEDYLIGSEIREENATPMPESMSPEELGMVRQQRRVVRLERLWAQLFAGQQLDEAEAFIERLEAERAEADARIERGDPAPIDQPLAVAAEVLQRYRGWLLVHQGEDLAAQQTLEPLIERDHLARWAMAVLREEQGVAREAIRHFAIIARQHPRKAIGSAALARVNALVDKPVIRSRVALQLDEHVAAFAPWLDAMVRDASAMMSARLVPEERSVDPMDPIMLRLTIRNVARWPLGVGKARPIPQRVLLAPKIRIDGADVSGQAAPIVLSVDHRLRLEMGEELEMSVNARRQNVGVMLDNNAVKRVDLRYQLVQRFAVGAETGAIAPGAMSITTLSDYVTRVAAAERLTPQEMAEALAGASGEALAETMLLGRVMLNRAILAEDDETLGAVRAAFLDRLPSMSGLEQAIAVTHLVEVGALEEDGLADLVVEAVAQRGDPLASAIAVLGLPRAATGPLIEGMLASDDPAAAALAEAWVAAGEADEPEIAGDDR